MTDTLPGCLGRVEPARDVGRTAVSVAGGQRQAGSGVCGRFGRCGWVEVDHPPAHEASSAAAAIGAAVARIAGTSIKSFPCERDALLIGLHTA